MFGYVFVDNQILQRTRFFFVKYLKIKENNWKKDLFIIFLKLSI